MKSQPQPIILALAAANCLWAQGITEIPKTRFETKYQSEYVAFLFRGTHTTKDYQTEKENPGSLFRLRLTGLLGISACFVLEYPVEDMKTVEEQLEKGSLILNQGLTSEKSHAIKGIKTRYGFVNPVTSSVWLYLSIPLEEVFEFGPARVILWESITLFCPLADPKQQEWRWVRKKPSLLGPPPGMIWLRA
jgi:hypothetical protein